jgi:hypothetical protein
VSYALFCLVDFQGGADVIPLLPLCGGAAPFSTLLDCAARAAAKASRRPTEHLRRIGLTPRCGALSVVAAMSALRFDPAFRRVPIKKRWCAASFLCSGPATRFAVAERCSRLSSAPEETPCCPPTLSSIGSV